MRNAQRRLEKLERRVFSLGRLDPWKCSLGYLHGPPALFVRHHESLDSDSITECPLCKFLPVIICEEVVLERSQVTPLEYKQKIRQSNLEKGTCK